MRKYLLHMALFMALLFLGGAMASATVSDNDNRDEAIVVEMPQPSVRLVPGAVEIVNPTTRPCQYVIVAITGSVVAQDILDADSEIRVELSPGYYIVKVDKTARRIAVK